MALVGTSVDVFSGDSAGRGGGSGACFALLASVSGRLHIGLPCAHAAQGGGEGGQRLLPVAVLALQLCNLKGLIKFVSTFNLKFNSKFGPTEILEVFQGLADFELSLMISDTLLRPKR